jgi:hypothetical protein
MPISCVGRGTGGAPESSHFLCVKAFFRRSRKIFSPPERKESLMLSGTVVEAGLKELRVGAGDSVRTSGCARCEGTSLLMRGAPHISQLRREGWFS